MTLRTLPALTLSLLVATACRGSGNGGDDDGIDSGGGGDLTIQEVQSDTMPAGTAVTLRGVVVTAIDNYGPRKGNFYVGEPAGGAYSGVLVFGAALDQVAALTVGDLVDITDAEKDEFSLPEDDLTVTELGPVAGGEMTVTRTGDGMVPEPQVIDALAIGRMAMSAREAEYEKWEGVLVRVNSVSVTSEIDTIGSMPDPTFVGFDITGVLEIDSSLAAIPYSTTPPPFLTGGDCLASITGMGDYFFNYKVLPRATADIVLGGTGCPAREAVGMCADGIDNDANGFLDCADRGCSAEPSCTTDTTIEMIQTGAVTGGVRLNDVVVLATKTFPTTAQGFWVSHVAQAAANQGIFIFTGSTAPTAAVNSLVDVTGSVTEFDFNTTGDKLTQIQNATITPAVGTATPIPLPAIPVATLASISSIGEPYESVLVTLSNMRVMAVVQPGDRVQLTNGTDTIVMDDEIYNYDMNTFAAGNCFQTVTGIMTVNTFDDERRLLPRSGTGTGGDIDNTGGTCN